MTTDDWPELDLDEAPPPVEWDWPELGEFEWPDLNLEVADNG